MKLTPPVRDVHSTAIIHPSIDRSHKASNKAHREETTKDPNEDNRSTHGRNRTVHGIHRTPSHPPSRPPNSSRPPNHPLYSNSLSQGVGDDRSRTRGDGRSYAGGSPRARAYRRGISNLILSPIPTHIQAPTTSRRTPEGAIPELWAYGHGALEAIQALSCDGVSLSDPWGIPRARGTETRNAAAADTGYIPFRDPELQRSLKGGPVNPPHIFAGSEGGVVA